MAESLGGAQWRYRSEQRYVPGRESLMERLYAARGYADEAQRAALFELRARHDPMQMKGMEAAVAALREAISKQAHVRVYGDYDADGVCSVALLVRLLRGQVPTLSWALANRYDNGYGLSKAAVADAIEAKVACLVVLDCGTSDLEAVAMARTAGLQVLICDHHLPGAELPACTALLNPKQLDCRYPAKELSAAAVGFKLGEALAQAGLLERSVLEACLDLVAVSLIADQMTLLGEPRLLVSEGLAVLRERPQQGLAALIEALKLPPRELDEEAVAYKLVPPLNAAGRLGAPDVAASLLCTEAQAEAQSTASHLLALNEERKALQTGIVEAAQAQLTTSPQQAGHAFLYDKDWHVGVIGIVAARCLELRPQPTLILGRMGDHWVGSLRSPEPIDAYDLLADCSTHLSRFGGHSRAAGCSVAAEQLASFERAFAAAVRRHTPAGDHPCAALWIDLPLALHEITPARYEAVAAFGPYGSGHPRPVFCASGLRAEQVRAFGEQGQVLRFNAVDDRGGRHEVIGFRTNTETATVLRQGLPFDMAYGLRQEHYGGQLRQQLRLCDLHFD